MFSLRPSQNILLDWADAFYRWIDINIGEYHAVMPEIDLEENEVFIPFPQIPDDPFFLSVDQAAIARCPGCGHTEAIYTCLINTDYHEINSSEYNPRLAEELDNLIYMLLLPQEPILHAKPYTVYLAPSVDDLLENTFRFTLGWEPYSVYANHQE